jgi:hypothetical protein
MEGTGGAGVQLLGNRIQNLRLCHGQSDGLYKIAVALDMIWHAQLQQKAADLSLPIPGLLALL